MPKYNSLYIISGNDQVDKYKQIAIILQFLSR